MTERRMEMNGYTTRSFIAMCAAVITTVMQLTGHTPVISEHVMIELALHLAPLAFGLWAYVERLYGKATLVFKPKNIKKIKEHNAHVRV